jgi:hypothetical protein
MFDVCGVSLVAVFRFCTNEGRPECFLSGRFLQTAKIAPVYKTGAMFV